MSFNYYELFKRLNIVEIKVMVFEKFDNTIDERIFDRILSISQERLRDVIICNWCRKHTKYIVAYNNHARCSHSDQNCHDISCSMLYHKGKCNTTTYKCRTCDFKHTSIIKYLQHCMNNCYLKYNLTQNTIVTHD